MSAALRRYGFLSILLLTFRSEYLSVQPMSTFLSLSVCLVSCPLKVEVIELSLKIGDERFQLGQ